MSVFRQKLNSCSKKCGFFVKKYQIFGLKMSIFHQKYWKLQFLKNCQKMNFWLWNMLIFRQKISNFSKKCQKLAKNCQNFSKFCLKNVNFWSKNLKIEFLKNCAKNEFFALKNVAFCSKIANFAGKKVKVFSKIVKNVRKKFKFSKTFFQKNWIFSGKLKNFKNLQFSVKKWIFFFKKVKKFQKICKKNKKNF